MYVSKDRARVLWLKERLKLERRARRAVWDALQSLVRSAETPYGSKERARAIRQARQTLESKAPSTLRVNHKEIP